MAISETVDLFEAQLWPQGDIRDPLGVWGARHGATGDVSGGGIKVGIIVPAARSAAFIYTCYSVNIAKLTGAIPNVSAKVRLLTGWPDIDPTEGVQGYSSLRIPTFGGASAFSSPQSGLQSGLDPLGPFDRFLLLFDPRAARNSALTIVEMELGDNESTATYSFEAYGYYWDRSVMQAPGGPRHPGAS